MNYKLLFDAGIIDEHDFVDMMDETEGNIENGSVHRIMEKWEAYNRDIAMLMITRNPGKTSVNRIIKRFKKCLPTK